MPTSYPLNLPATPGFQQIKMQQVTQVSMSQSPFSGVQQVQEWPAEWWQAEVSLPPMTRANAAAWTAFFAQCRGRSGTILAGDSGAKIPRGLVSGSIVTNGASQSGRILYLKGAAPSALIFAAGDYVQLGAGAGATRITTTGGTSVAKYFVDFGVSVSGQPYVSSLRIFNLGTKNVIVSDNINQATIAPGVRTGVQLLSTGDGVAHLQMLFSAAVASDSLDFIVWAPRAQHQGIDENFISPGGLNFASGWSTFSGSAVSLVQNYNQRLYQAVSDSVSDSAGNVAIEVFPRLRADAMGNGDPVVYQACKGLFRLQSNLREWDIDEAMLYGISFKLIEAF